jgi:transposase
LKDYVKLHAAIDDRGAAFAIAITDGTTNDSVGFPYLIGDVNTRLGVVRADAAYLSRDNVQLVEDLGALPYIKPRSDSKMMSKGRFAWRHMRFRYRQDKDAFLREYNQQRRIEAFFSRFKGRFGPVKSRVGTMRRKEIWMKVLILNILTVAGEQIEEELKVAG